MIMVSSFLKLLRFVCCPNDNPDVFCRLSFCRNINTSSPTLLLRKIMTLALDIKIMHHNLILLPIIINQRFSITSQPLIRLNMFNQYVIIYRNRFTLFLKTEVRIRIFNCPHSWVVLFQTEIYLLESGDRGIFCQTDQLGMKVHISVKKFLIYFYSEMLTVVENVIHVSVKRVDSLESENCSTRRMKVFGCWDFVKFLCFGERFEDIDSKESLGLAVVEHHVVSEMVVAIRR